MGVAVFLGVFELLVLFLVPVVLLAVVVGVVLVATARSEATLTSEVACARRHAVTTSAVSALLMLGAPLLLVLCFGVTVVTGLAGLPFLTSARVLAVAPLVGVLAGLCALLVGELTWPRPTGTSRTALHQDRSLRTLLQGAWVRAAAATTVLTAAALVVGGLVADGSGQAIRHQRVDGAETAGPFPGWVYAGPQLTVLLLCGLVAALTLRAVLRRSAVVTADADTDGLLRRASVGRVCRALTAGALVTLGPDLFLGGAAAARAFDDGGWHTVAVALMATAPFLVLAGLVVLVLPVPRLPAVSAYPVPPAPSVPMGSA
jgi:hypothetical protein